MYSVVLMAALTVGGETPDFGRRGGRCGGCYGGCSGGWSGCFGCWGGGYVGRGCYGCSGCYGRWGGGCYGCFGGCYRACGGCYGCGGGCYGCGCGGFSYGSPSGVRMGYGGYSGAPGVYMAQVPMSPPLAQPVPQAAPATVVVNLPADARLSVQGQPTRSNSSRRVFVSPPLEPGQSYSYTLKAQVVRDGQPLSVTREVAVRPGGRTEVNIDFPTATASARR
jgi:uncharacterized protein (TIGR03000 family)